MSDELSPIDQAIETTKADVAICQEEVNFMNSVQADEVQCYSEQERLEAMENLAKYENVLAQLERLKGLE